MGVKGFTNVLQAYFPKSTTKIDALMHPKLFQFQRFGTTNNPSLSLHTMASSSPSRLDSSRGLKDIESFSQILNSDSFANYDHLLFDMNCVLIANLRRKEFHLEHHSLDQSQYIRKMESMNRRLFLTVDNYLNALISSFAPSSTVHLCLDGPGPVYKIPTQSRSRNRTNDRWFNLLQVTTGTQFMSDYHSYVRKVYGGSVLRRYEQLNQVHFSSSNMPGEGECKIFQNIAQLNSAPNESPMSTSKQQKFAVCSVDADLVLYAVAALNANVDILLLKESNSYLHINTSKLVDCYLKPLYSDVAVTRRDFVLLSLLNGSDYVSKFGSESPLHTWLEYSKIRSADKGTFANRSIISWNNTLSQYELDIEFLISCMPMRKVDARQPNITPKIEQTVINYFQMVLWNFEMLLNGKCNDYWFLPSGFIIAPRWFEVEQVYRFLGHEEFNRKIQPKERIHFDQTSHLSPFFPHELCSAVSPGYYRNFVPKSLQDLDPFIDFATRNVNNCMHPEGSLNFESLVSYQELIRSVVNVSDLSQFETTDTIHKH